MMAGQIAGKAGMLGSIIVLSRYLSDVSFGRLTLAVALGHVVFFISDMGVSLVSNRRISRNAACAQEVFSGAATLRIALGALGVALLLAVGLLGGYSPQHILFFGVVGVAATLRSGAEVTYAVYRGRERMVYEGIARSVMGLASFGLALLVVLFDLGDAGAAGVYLVRALLAVSVGLLFLGRLGVRPRPAPPSRSGYIRGLLRDSLPLGIMGLLFIAYQRLDNLLIQATLGDAAVGAYQECYRLLEVMVLAVAPTLLPGALFPGLCRSYAAGWEHTVASVRDMTEAFMVMAAVLTLPVYAGGIRLMRMIWGEAFLRGQAAGDFMATLYLLMATLPVFYLMHLLLATILATDRQRVTAYAAGAAVALSIAGNLVLLPVMGLPAAGLMALLSTGLIVTVFYTSLARKHAPLPLWRALPRPLAATAVGVAAALLIGGGPLALRVAAPPLVTAAVWLAMGGAGLTRKMLFGRETFCTEASSASG